MLKAAHISVVIPTLNRPEDLLIAVESVLSQEVLPGELVIIDQSVGNASKEQVNQLLRRYDSSPFVLTYLHDSSSIKGLIEAKERAVQVSSGDIVCFLEDDIELLPDYIRQINKFFSEDENVMGCGGVVVDVPGYSDFYRFFFKLIHRGIFFDQRVELHARVMADNRPVQSRYISGGVSSYRRIVFEQVPFDTKNGFFALEDIEFSTRAADHFGDSHFFINPKVRLLHHMSLANRAVLGKVWERKVREFLLYYKKHRQKPGSLIDLCVLLVGLFMKSLINSITKLTFEPVMGFCRGVVQGIRQKIMPLSVYTED